jgi:hypothetical protein
MKAHKLKHVWSNFTLAFKVIRYADEKHLDADTSYQCRTWQDVLSIVSDIISEGGRACAFDSRMKCIGKW